jgi:formylmethanofuran dehydrogenase subunit D
VFKFMVRRTLAGIVSVLLIFGGMAGVPRVAFAGATWVLQTSGLTSGLVGAEYGGGQFVAAGASGGLATSPDGAAWTARSASGDWNGLAYSGLGWVAVGYSGKMATSTNGASWTVLSPGGLGNIWYDVAYGAGQFVAPEANSPQVWRSSDGTTWSTVTVGGSALYGIGYGGGRFVAVGLNGARATSTDGTSWVAGTFGVAANMWDVAYGNSLFVAVGDSGKIFTSSDGSAWTARTSGTTQGLLGIAYGNGVFVASGYSGTILRSPDGITWTADTSGSTAGLQRVAFGGSTFVIVGDSGTVLTSTGLSTNANLSNLTATGGTLSPAFASGTTSYSLGTVPYTTGSIAVTPSVADSTATVRVNGSVTASGTPVTVPVGVGANTVSVEVTAQDGTTQKTYSISVNRAAASTNANLANLTVSAGTLSPGFSSGITGYTVAVPNATTSLNVTPTVADGTATMTVNGTPQTSGSPRSVSLIVGANPVNVVVTAQDGITQKTYTVTVNRAPANNADLAGLAIDHGALTPAFASATTTYSAGVGNSVTSLQVTPTLSDSLATMTVNGGATTSGSAVSVPLAVGVNPVTIVVTAQDGTTQNTYTVTVTRASPSSNAGLSALTVSQGTLTPSFDVATLTYTVSVPYATGGIAVTPTVADSTATMTVNGAAAASGSAVPVSLVVGGNSVTVVVTAQDGTTQKSYVITITRAPSSNADLGSLTLSTGTLTPVFAPATLSYTAGVGNSVTSLTVTPTVADATATMTVNGAAAVSGSAVPVSLNVGANTVTIVVTAQDGTTQLSYVITITRAPSSNADLDSLTLSTGTLTPVFAPATLSYTASAGNSVTSLAVKPTVADATATITVNGAPAASGFAAPVSLNVGANTVTIVVTAQDGTTQKSYVITITRAPSSNADLGSLTVSAGTLTPAFAPATLNYTVGVGNSIASLGVTPTVADATATVTVNGAAAPNGSAATVPLNVGANTVTVVVTAQDGTTQTSYVITITRAPSSNADLGSLTLSTGTLTPVFAPATLSYTVGVGNSVTSLTVTPTVADATATMTVNGAAAVSGSAVPVSLNVGANTVPIVVTAQDGSTQTSYVITITRAPSSNADLGSLTLSTGTLTPVFAPATLNYTVGVGNSVTSLTVTPTVADATASMTVNGTAAVSGNVATVLLNVGANTVTIVVTAQDGTTQQSYVITITRAPSSNADLDSLTLSTGTLTPVFAPATLSYTVGVGNSVTSLAMTPTVADATATMTVNGAAAASGSAATVPLNVGANTVTIVVTAQDGTTQTSYVITITRAPSSNADLGGLTVSAGTLTPAFAPATLNYTVGVGNSIASLGVTPTVADATATVTVNGAAAASGSAATVPLNVGANTVTVVVTAQDGTTQTSYVITITRAPSSNADLGSLTLSTGTLTPVFAPATLNYTVGVGNSIANLGVTPTVADATATMTVNGAAAVSGSAVPVSLNVGANTVTVVVTAQDGTTQQSYVITITRAPSSNADLGSLTLSTGTLTPVFAPATLSYTLGVGNSVTSLTVTPTVADATASMTVNGDAAVSGIAVPVSLTVGDNPVTIVVTAQDGTTQQSYVITITRAPSSNADLDSLTVSSGSLTPAFDPATLSYTVDLPYPASSIQVTPFVADPTATVKVDGTVTASGSAATAPLSVGPNTVTILVTAQDGTTEKTYTVTVNRTAPSTNATLAGLTVSPGNLRPAFDPALLRYTAGVGYGVTEARVLPTVADATATVKVNGIATASGAIATVSLHVGANPITILVTAQDGTTQKSYIITMYVDAPPLPPGQPPHVTISAPFTLTREATITVSGTAGPGLSVQVGGTTVQADAAGTWSATVALIEGENVITATSGTTSATVTVTRDSTPPEIRLTASTLQTERDRVRLTATSEPGALIEINGQEGSTLIAPLAVGENTFAAIATDKAGNQATTTVRVTRLAPEQQSVSVVVPPQRATAITYAFWTMQLPTGVASAPLQLMVQTPTSGSQTGQVGNAASVISVSEVIVTTTEGDPVHQLQKNLTMTFSYDPNTVTDPSKLRIFYFDPVGGAWVSLGGVVDETNHTVTVQVDHFTLFAVMAPTGVVPELNLPPAVVHTAALALTGKGEAGATVTLVVNGTAQSAATVGLNGRFTLTAALTEGANRLYVIGKGTLSSGEATVTYQPVAPQEPDTPQEPGEATPSTFSDVDGHWALPYIERMAKLNMVKGYDDRTFRPEAPVSRLEFAVMVARLLRLDPVNAPLPFADKSRIPEWGEAQLAAAFKAGIVTGRDDGTFDPDARVTRAEVAVMLVRALRYSGRDVAPGNAAFADGDRIPDWARAQVLAAARFGLVTGYADGTFRADETATRAEAVTMLARLMDALSR